MRYSPKPNRLERRTINAEKLANNMGGSGLYIYENNTNSDLKLPKPTASGVRVVGPRKRFQGDSYYLIWVGRPLNLLRLIEEITPKKTTQEIAEEIARRNSPMNEQKLILDQPDTITSKGKIEHVVDNEHPVQPLNDSTASKPAVDFLLNENPLDGVAITKG